MSRAQSLPYFLEAEGLVDKVKDGILKLKTSGVIARHSGAHLLAWSYLGTWYVSPSNAKQRLGSVTVSKRTMRISSYPVGEDCRRDTILHEVAHVISHYAHGTQGKGHGKEWRRIAIALGARPSHKARKGEVSEKAVEMMKSELRTVAQCEKCGLEQKGYRASNCYEKRVYIHRGCGGRVRTIRGR